MELEYVMQNALSFLVAEKHEGKVKYSFLVTIYAELGIQVSTEHKYGGGGLNMFFTHAMVSESLSLLFNRDPEEHEKLIEDNIVYDSDVTTAAMYAAAIRAIMAVIIKAPDLTVSAEV